MGKLYIIRNEYEPNSAPHNRLVGFLNAFEKSGIETELVFPFPNYERSKPDLHYNHIKVSYLYEKCKLFHNRIIAKLCAPWIFRKFIKQLKEDDVVLVLNVGILLNMLKKYSKVKVYHETTESPDIVPWRLKRLKRIYLEGSKKVDGLFVISTALKEYFINIGIPENKITIINMTVDCSRFEGITKQSVKPRYIAYCGTASNNKDGVNKLIEAFGIVAQKHKDVQLHIIGKAPSESDESNNLRLIDRLGIKDRVIFTGIVPASDMPQVLTNASVLALARPDNLQAKNGFPTKLGEYLLTGNPVVVTNVGDIPLFLNDGESALIAKAGDTQEFADKLCWALEHPHDAATIGDNGRKIALHHFNSTIEVQKIINVISL